MKKKTELSSGSRNDLLQAAFPGVAGATTIDDLMQAGTEGAEEETAGEAALARRAGNHFCTEQPAGWYRPERDEQFLCDSVSDQLFRGSCDL